MSYLDRIQKAISEAKPGDFILKGTLLLVEKLDNEAKSSSGITLGVSSHVQGIANQSMEKVRVLAVGEGYYDSSEDKEVPLDTHAGDIIFTQGGQIKWLPTAPGLGYVGGKVGLMDESATQIRFRGEAPLKEFERGCSGAE